MTCLRVVLFSLSPPLSLCWGLIGLLGPADLEPSFSVSALWGLVEAVYAL